MSKVKKKVRGKSRYYLYWILLLGVVCCGSYTAVSFFRDMDFFRIKDIHIRGNRLVNKDYLYSIAEPFIGLNIFEFEAAELALRFDAMSRVKGVKIMRIFPSRLVITVTERTGVFYIKDNLGEFYPIDSDRYVLDKADWYLEEDLPLINVNIPKEKIVIGQRIEDPRIEYVFQIHDIVIVANVDILSDISEYYFINNDLYFIDIRSGSRVILCTDEIPRQIDRFIFLRNNQGFRRNSTIDLRFGSQIVVT